MNSEREMNRFLESVQLSAFRMAQMACGSREDALDVVQDSMLRFVTSYQNKPREQWRPLFYKVLNSKTIDWHRRQKVRSIVHWFGHSQDYEEAAIAREEPESRGEHEQAMVKLDQALAQLPQKQRQAVLLRTWEGLSTEDTAVAMGVSHSSVKTHLARGLKAVRLQLGEHWP